MHTSSLILTAWIYLLGFFYILSRKREVTLNLYSCVAVMLSNWYDFGKYPVSGEAWQWHQNTISMIMYNSRFLLHIERQRCTYLKNVLEWMLYRQYCLETNPMHVWSTIIPHAFNDNSIMKSHARLSLPLVVVIEEENYSFKTFPYKRIETKRLCLSGHSKVIFSMLLS